MNWTSENLYKPVSALQKVLQANAARSKDANAYTTRRQMSSGSVPLPPLIPRSRSDLLDAESV